LVGVEKREGEGGSWKGEVGSWKGEAGSWKLEAGSWKLEGRSWKLEELIKIFADKLHYIIILTK
jgi:hypothetical protein